jgi:hypothetical protein
MDELVEHSEAIRHQILVPLEKRTASRWRRFDDPNEAEKNAASASSGDRPAIRRRPLKDVCDV